MALVTRGSKGSALSWVEMDGNLNLLFTPQEYIIYVNELADLGSPSGGIYTLLAGKTYVITTDIDLIGGRIVAGGVCNLFGLSSEVSSLTSTGLGVGVPMITSEYTIVIENITLKDVDTCLSINGNSRIVALDWENVNFSGIPNIGVINTCDNFIYDTGAFLSAQGLKFTGTVGTIGINNSLFVGTGSAGNIIELDSNAVVTRRFRIIYSSMVAISSTVALNVNTGATIPTESYILDTINFSGGGNYISGVQYDDNKALFEKCKGITNSAKIGGLYIQDNITATTVSEVETYYKIAGTTTPLSINQKFTHSNNRLTYVGAISEVFSLSGTTSLISGNNNIIGVVIFKNGVETVGFESRGTANAGGRAENISFFWTGELQQNDYIELFCENYTSATNITAESIFYSLKPSSN